MFYQAPLNVYLMTQIFIGGGEKNMRIEYRRGSKKAGNQQFSKEDGMVVLNQFTDSIKKQVGGSVCPEHGLHPTVKVKGRNFDKVEFEVSGCCQKVIDIVNARLK
jgi:hypothetical protein